MLDGSVFFVLTLLTITETRFTSTVVRSTGRMISIGLVDYEDVLVGRSYTKMITLKEGFNWLLTEEFEKLREGFEPVDNRTFMVQKEDDRVDDEDSTHKGKQDPYTRSNNFNIRTETSGTASI